MCTVIYGGSDAAAEATAQRYRDGLDEGAVLGMLESYGATLPGADNAMVARAKGAFMTHTVIGSPATCAQKIASFLRDCALGRPDADLRRLSTKACASRGAKFCRACGALVMSLKDWIAPARTALLLMDMQVDFAAPDGALGQDGADMTAAQAAIRNAAMLADAARAAGVPLPVRRA